MYIKITLNALTQFSINEHVYNSKIAYKKLFLNCFKTFPILNCWSNNSDNVSYSNITVNPLKFDFGKNLQAKCRIVKIKYR